jgi:peptide/nickel transport system permease protein
MGTYIIRRVLWTLLLLVAISAITFGIFNILPSTDAAQLRAGRNATPESIAAIREQFHLNDPKLEQFGRYMKDVFFHFDFGTSIVNDAEVRPLIFDRLPNTLWLIIGAALVWFLAGVVVGTISAVRRGTLLDRFTMTTALVLISAPVYWLGLVAIYLFSDDLGKFPILPGAGAFQQAHGFLDKAHAMIMPWIVLASAFAAIYARLLRSNMLEVMSEDYIRTARAKGLPERSVIRHGLRSAITPIVTVLGLDLGILVGGAILTESVFSIPGIGRLSFDAIQRGDLVTIQGTTLFLALAVCLMSLVVDVLYAFLDPRVRY